MIRVRYVVLLSAVAGAVPAGAAIVPINDGRYVRWEESFQGVDLSQPSSPFSDFEGQAGLYEGSAAQSSRIAQLSMSGESSYEQFGGGGVSVDSTFSVVFRVDEAGRYRFTGKLFGGTDGANPYDEPDQVRAVLTREGIDLVRVDVTDLERLIDFSRPVDLVPEETYMLGIWFRGGGPFHRASWSFEFASALEPSTFALVGAGLIAIVARRRSVQKPLSVRTGCLAGSSFMGNAAEQGDAAAAASI